MPTYTQTPTGWVSDEELARMVLGAQQEPPQYILDAMGGSYDRSRYYWNPDNMSLVARDGSGSYGFGDVPNPSLGTNVVLPYGSGGGDQGYGGGGTNIGVTQPGYGDTLHFDQGENPYFGFGDGREMFISSDPNAIDAYQHDAQTRSLQGVASVGALVGGAALGGALSGGGSGAATAPGYGGPATTYPLASAGGTIAATPIAAGAGAATVAGATTAAGAAGGAAAAGGGLLGSSPWLNGAIVGSSLLSGVLGAKAGEEGVEASREAVAESRRQFDTARGDLLPVINLAGSSAPLLQRYLSGDRTAFTESPSYQFNLQEGQKAIDRSLASRGKALSGAGVREGVRYASGLASNEDSKFVDQLLAAAGLGTTGASVSANAGANSAAQVGSGLMAGANSRASGYNSLNNAVQGGISNLLLQRYLRAA
jgi:hypothetical protein